ncbi:hypothetical protein scyTo_0025530 [Scyliorhinus torazame]|uniref:Uncharacterized protein n=1 Tax=Scyliorhinus torazame TaxID=75743 RepID=A0A401QHG8_SCYTO|nr:hypothetical protein [Scyliorhinus torazame]
MTEPIVGVSLLDIRHEAEESVNQSQIRARAGERWGALRNEALAARKEDDREIHSPLAQGPNLAFLSLHFDQSCDEDVGNRRFWKLSPPDPLQSQVNLNSSSAVTDSLQSQATEPPSQPLNPPGLGSNIELPASKTQFSAPGSPGQGHPACLSHSLSPNQSLLQGIDLQLLTAAPLSLDVQETLLRSPLFQPKVLLLRLTGQNVRSALPAEWGVQRGDSGGDVEQFQLGSAANFSELNPRPFPWNLRKRPQRTPPDRTIEEQVMLYGSDSPFLSSEESSQSDTSDSEYFPFCSQIQHSGQWRNSIGQFIGSKG